MYRNFNIMVVLLRKILIVILLIGTLPFPKAAAQHPFFAPIPSSQWIEQHKDSLRLALLNNKQLPEEFEHSILAALIYYPDLEKSHINFNYRAITTTMAALPTAGSLFRKRDNRRYSIIINYKKNKRKVRLMENVTYEARVGVIGHELAHIVDYRNKNFFHIIGNGISYTISKNFRRNLEYKIDRITINRGLGEGLLAFRQYIEDESVTTERYRRFNEYIYMTSAEISQMIESLDELAIDD